MIRGIKLCQVDDGDRQLTSPTTTVSMVEKAIKLPIVSKLDSPLSHFLARWLYNAVSVWMLCMYVLNMAMNGKASWRDNKR